MRSSELLRPVMPAAPYRARHAAAMPASAVAELLPLGLMRGLIAILFLALSTGARSESWPPAYSEVRAYYYDGGDSGAPVIKNGELHPTVQNKEGVLLTEKQVRHLLAAALDKEKNPHALINCYRPRHGFVFYDRAKHAAAVFEVCLDCLHIRFEPPRDESICDFLSIARLCEELGLPLNERGTTVAEFRARLDGHKERWEKRQLKPK